MRLLWEYCNEGNLPMVEYITSLPGIYDHKMKDGTTAFAIALARKDIDVLRTLMAAQLASDIDHKQLAQRAILDLDRNMKDDYHLLREVLIPCSSYSSCSSNSSYASAVETLPPVRETSPRQKSSEE